MENKISSELILETPLIIELDDLPDLTPDNNYEYDDLPDLVITNNYDYDDLPDLSPVNNYEYDEVPYLLITNNYNYDELPVDDLPDLSPTNNYDYDELPVDDLPDLSPVNNYEYDELPADDLPELSPANNNEYDELQVDDLPDLSPVNNNEYDELPDLLTPNNECDELVNIDIDNTTKNEFKKQVKDNLKKLRDIGFRVYHNIGLEKEVNLNTQTVTNNDIHQVYNYKTGSMLTRKGLMTDIARTTIFPKYKSGDDTKPENFRYLVNHHNTIKILDRLWCSDLVLKCKNNLPDINIFKSNLLKTFNGSIIDVAIKNTETIDSIVLLDIERAFDSLDWTILEELLLSNLTRKTNQETAEELVNQYMTIIRNRELYYNNILVLISKGIPTGLPSSNIIFTLAVEEIIYRWFMKTNLKNNIDFILNIYVDDIYLKILDKSKTHFIVNSLIEHLLEYKLKVNKSKSKADNKLGLTDISKKLSYKDYYLGIPFTRDINLYGSLILKEFQNNKMKLSWTEIYNILSSPSTEFKQEKSIIIGFMNYKLKPLTTISTKEHIQEFIKKHYLANEQLEELLFLLIIMNIIIIAFMMLFLVLF